MSTKGTLEVPQELLGEFSDKFFNLKNQVKRSTIYGFHPIGPEELHTSLFEMGQLLEAIWEDNLRKGLIK